MKYLKPVHISPARPRRKPGDRLALAFVAFIGGCAGSPHQATTSEYYRDSRLCRAQNPIKPKVRTNLAGNLSEDIVAGVDTPNYLKCMDRLGWRQEPKTDPLLSALEKCRKKAALPATATAEPGGTQIGSSLDRAAFRECLKQRGFGEVTVEPLQAAPPK